MSRDTSLRVRVEVHNKTCPAQARASERKRRNRLENGQLWRQKAMLLGIPVEELRAKEYSLFKVEHAKVMAGFKDQHRPARHYRGYSF